jgi:predicted metal-binding membrane protein
VGVGYFFVWTVFGMAAFPVGVALAAVTRQQPALARAVPIATGVVIRIVIAPSSVPGLMPPMPPM